jgi:hypothetical protein
MGNSVVDAKQRGMLADKWRSLALLSAVVLFAPGLGAQPLTKAVVGEKIRQVENGVDEFRNYLNQRGDNARSAASSPQGQARQGKRRTATESQQAAATARKDELDDALGDLNRSTNRLRRKFDPTDKWQETRVQVERVLDDGRRINQAVARGNYGSQVARLWAALRNSINDLARAYGLTPLGV